MSKVEFKLYWLKETISGEHLKSGPIRQNKNFKKKEKSSYIYLIYKRRQKIAEAEKNLQIYPSLTSSTSPFKLCCFFLEIF